MTRAVVCSALFWAAALAPRAAPSGDPPAPPPPPAGPSVTLPADFTVPVNRLASVAIQFRGKALKWRMAGADVDSFREYDPDPAVIRLRFVGYSPGQVVIEAAASGADGSLTDIANCVVTIAGPDPPPVPPTPPGPTPPTPTPPVPVPGAKVWLVVVEETSARTPEQAALLGALDFWKGLEAKGHHWRFYDKDNPAVAAKHYDAALAAAKLAVPALLVIDPTGKVLKAAALPADQAGVTAALQSVVGGN